MHQPNKQQHEQNYQSHKPSSTQSIEHTINQPINTINKATQATQTTIKQATKQESIKQPIKRHAEQARNIYIYENFNQTNKQTSD